MCAWRSWARNALIPQMSCGYWKPRAIRPGHFVSLKDPPPPSSFFLFEIKKFSPQLLIWMASLKRLSLLNSLKEKIGSKNLPVLCVLHSRSESVPKRLQERRYDSACVETEDSSDAIVSCLNSGADDFIHRPFDPRILLARAENLIRRELRNGRTDNLPHIYFESGKISVDLLSREAKLKGKALPLTRFEFDLLAFLIKKDGKALERKEILSEVWKYPEEVETRTLDKHIETLRKKLASESRRLQTVHGFGYRFLPSTLKEKR